MSFLNNSLYAYKLFARTSISNTSLFLKTPWIIVLVAPFIQVILWYAAPHGMGTGDGQVDPLNDVKFNFAVQAPVVANTGWTRNACDSLKDEELVKFQEAFTKKILKMLISSNLNMSSYKATEMDDKSNFFMRSGNGPVHLFNA